MVDWGELFGISFGIFFGLCGIIGIFTFIPLIQPENINLGIILGIGLSALLIGISIYFLKESLDL